MMAGKGSEKSEGVLIKKNNFKGVPRLFSDAKYVFKQEKVEKT